MKVVEKQRVDETAGETEGARRATGVFPGGGALRPEVPLQEQAAEHRRDDDRAGRSSAAPRAR